MIEKTTALTEKALEALLILTARDEETVTPQDLEADLWHMVECFCPDLINQQHQMEYN
jgi:hypothetical protein